MIGRLAFLTTEAIRRSKSLRLLKEISREPQYDRGRVLERQFDRLSRLLDHAEQTVPYYREIFRRLGIKSRDIRSFDDFGAFPVLTKDIVRTRQLDLLSSAFDVSKLQPHH